MIGDEIRTLVVGGSGLVWGRITEKTGANLLGESLALRTVAPDGTASVWAPADEVDTSQAASGVVRAAVEHVASVTGVWELQAKVGTEILKVGPFQVVDA